MEAYRGRYTGVGLTRTWTQWLMSAVAMLPQLNMVPATYEAHMGHMRGQMGARWGLDRGWIRNSKGPTEMCLYDTYETHMGHVRGR